MRFLTPTFLALAGLAAPIIILYMLRLRRREVKVSSTMLWQRLLQDREANAPWQKLKRNLLLLLQLLILAALVFALARPFIPVPSVASGSVAVILDASASMSTKDQSGGGTRFEAAKSAARQLVGDLSSNEVMTVIAAGPVPQVLTPPTSDAAALRDAINRAQPSEAPSDWGAALALAAASIAGHDKTTLVVISDGGVPDDLPPLPAEIRYVRIGRASENLAISALATRAQGDQPELFAAVTNYGTQDADVILSVNVDGELQSADKLHVEAGKTADVTLTDLPADSHQIRAELTPPVEGGVIDPLPLDDTAYAIYSPINSGRVLLVTDGNLFLEQIFASLPTVQAFKLTPGDLPQGEHYDLVVYDRWLPNKLPDTNLLIIDPPATTNLFTVGEKFENTGFLKQADDPILSFVDFSDVAIREAVRVETPGWGEALVEAEGGPLLIAGQTAGRRVAILTFDLHASNLPLKLSYPILMSNLIEWYAPARPFDAPPSLQPGNPVTIRPQAATTAYRITWPDGRQQTYPLGEIAPTFAATDLLGVYRVELLSGNLVTLTGDFAVNLFSPIESQIAPKDSITIGQAEVSDKPTDQNYGQRELWVWLAILALIVLVAEWWVYHRGSVLPGASSTGSTPRGLLRWLRRPSNVP